MHFVTCDEDLVAKVGEVYQAGALQKADGNPRQIVTGNMLVFCARLTYRYESHLSLSFFMTSFPESIA